MTVTTAGSAAGVQAARIIPPTTSSENRTTNLVRMLPLLVGIAVSYISKPAQSKSPVFPRSSPPFAAYAWRQSSRRIDQMTRHPVARQDFPPGRHLLGADLLGQPATGAETTAGRGVGRAGDVPLKDNRLSLLLHLGIGHRNRRKQSLAVGVERLGVQLVTLGLLDP